MKRKLSGQLGVLGTGVLIGLVLRLVQSASLARLLGVAEFGKFATVAALMAIVSRLNDLGLPSSVTYHFRRQPAVFASLMRVVRLDFFWCCTVSLAVALAAPHLPFAFAADLHASWSRQLLLAGFIAINTPTWILPAFISAAGHYSTYARLTNLDAGLQAVLSVGACLVFGPSYLHVIAALTLEQLLMTAVYLCVVERYRPRLAPVEVPNRQMLSYGLRLQWGVLMKLLSSRLDILTVSAVTSATSAGLYSVALSIRELGLLPQSVYAAPFQNLVIDRSHPGAASDRSAVITSLLLQTGLSLIMVLAAAIVLPVLIPVVYGPAFRHAVLPAVVLFASVIFLGPAGLCWMTFNAKGRPHLTSVILTASGLVGPALTYVLLVRGHGLVGAACAGVAAAFITFALCLFALQRLQHYRRSDVRAGLKRARSICQAAAAHIRSLAVRRITGAE